MANSIDRIILIRRPTRLEELIRRFNTVSQASFYVESRGQSFEDYILENETYSEARRSVIGQIPRDIKYIELDRMYLTNYVFGPNDLIMTLGQDGLVVNVAKYLNGQSVFAVNPDPQRFDGVLLPFSVDQVSSALTELMNGSLRSRAITMAAAELNDGQSLLAFNDLFIGPRDHTSARYEIHYRDESERQSSSGIIISTPAGSTGWMSSIFHMSRGVSQFRQSNLTNEFPELDLSWEDRKLVFAVREPFLSQVSQVGLVAGFIEEGEELVLESQMSDSGIIFSDGMQWDFLEFNAGAKVKIQVAARTTNLLVRS